MKGLSLLRFIIVNFVLKLYSAHFFKQTTQNFLYIHLIYGFMLKMIIIGSNQMIFLWNIAIEGHRQQNYTNLLGDKIPEVFFTTHWAHFPEKTKKDQSATLKNLFNKSWEGSIPNHSVSENFPTEEKLPFLVSAWKSISLYIC